jgi:hypothetical protein
VQIDQPSIFSGSTELFAGAIDLVGLAQADSYGYTKDLLSIYSGNKILEPLRLVDQAPYGFGVVEASESVNIVALTSSGETLQGALPLHT